MKPILHSLAMPAAMIAAALISHISDPPSVNADSSELPNIVLILADDLGYGDVGCYGATKIPTPNIDRLASQGIRFTDTHSPSSVCTPTRYGLLTGRYCWRSRLKADVLHGYSPPLIEPQRMTVASLLKQYGYATACVGKWHLGLGWSSTDSRPLDEQADNVDYTKPLTGGPLTAGFDYFFGISAPLDFAPYCFIENDRTVGTPTETKTHDHLPPRYREQRPGLMVPGWKDDQVGPVITRRAVRFIEQHADQNHGQPFFLYFALSAPHVPLDPPDFVQGKSQAGRRGDMCAEVDWSVGEVMKTLDRLKLSDNTLLIFTSDNGALYGDLFPPGRQPKYYGHPDNYETFGHQANGIYRGGKFSIYEGGTRVPFVARWPGRIEPQARSDATVCLTDLLATCAAIVRHKLPQDAGEDSYNILPALLGEAPQKRLRTATVLHSVNAMFAIRQGPWKLIDGMGPGDLSWRPADVSVTTNGPSGQLYNLAEDPTESQNLYRQYPDVVQRLDGLLDQYRRADRSVKLDTVPSDG